MMTFANTLIQLRSEKFEKILDLGFASGINPSLLSRYEKGNRLPSDKHIELIGKALDDHSGILRKAWLAERVAGILKYEEAAVEILELAEDRIEYLRSQQKFELPVLDDELAQSLDQLTALRDKWQDSKPLSGLQLSKMMEYFHTEYTFESNRIEGNTLTLQETHLVINEGITIEGKSMREHLEAVNHKEAVDFLIDLVNHKEDLTPGVLSELHRLILKSIDPKNAGRYRSVPVRIFGSEHMPPQPYLLDKLMEEYFEHYQMQKIILHPVLLAAEMHERLVSIHPFIDGNGRTSRLVMNLILLRNGYTIATLKGDLKSRKEYYRALEEIQVHNTPGTFYRLVIQKVRESLNNHLEMI